MLEYFLFKKLLNNNLENFVVEESERIKMPNGDFVIDNMDDFKYLKDLGFESLEIKSKDDELTFMGKGNFKFSDDSVLSKADVEGELIVEYKFLEYGKIYFSEKGTSINGKFNKFNDVFFPQFMVIREDNKKFICAQILLTEGNYLINNTFDRVSFSDTISEELILSEIKANDLTRFSILSSMTFKRKRRYIVIISLLIIILSLIIYYYLFLN